MLDIDLSQTHKLAASSTGLPGGVSVVGYAVQPYHWIGEAGPIHVAEHLVRMMGPDGKKVNNERYFDQVHADKLGFDVDYDLTLRGIDWAVTHGHLDPKRPDKVAAFNLFPHSIDQELFHDIAIKLKRHGLKPENVLLEILEKRATIGLKHLDAIRYGRDLGLLFGADDVDPRKMLDRERVQLIGPDCTVIKLRREVIRDYRNGNYPNLLSDLETMMDGQNFYLLAEGVPRANQLELKGLPIRATQSQWDELTPARAK